VINIKPVPVKIRFPGPATTRKETAMPEDIKKEIESVELELRKQQVELIKAQIRQVDAETDRVKSETKK
jgi:hypothetical protein